MTQSIKLLELFSGIQAQERALRQIGVPYESVGVCDCDKDVLVSAAAMRFDLEQEIVNYNFPSVEIMISELQAKNIGFSFEKGKHTITTRTPINKLKQYYISDKLLNNLGDISKVERLPHADLVTYSSPCQSFSVAGKLGGAAKTCKVCGHKWDIDFSNPDYNYKCPICGNVSLESTTSGLLSEVQRLLSIAYENNELPRFLLLENVKNLVGKKFIHQFNDWIQWLNGIGYNTYYKVLNSKNYGLPQNRERVFALSIRKDVDNSEFKFPDKIPLNIRLKDVLEKNVDEKFYLPDDRIDKILNSTFMQEKKRIQMKDVCDTLLARDWKDPKCVQVGQLEYSFEQSGRVYDVDGISPTIMSNSHGKTSGGYTSPKIMVEEPNTCLIQPKDRDYKKKNKPREIHIESKDDGISYALRTNGETMVIEPFIVASRGRNPDNPSDRTTGSPTEQRLEPNFSGCTNTLTSVQKDNYVAEPQVLRAERTEYGKAIRKQYEAGEVYEKIGNMRELTPRTDGISNTITTLQKDNYVCEPIVCEERRDEGIRLFKDDCVGTLRTIDACGDKRVIEPNPRLVGGIGEKNFGKQYRQGNRVYDSDAVAMALNAQPVGNAGGYSYLYTVEEPNNIKWRIRKLTPKECWRLMGFTDEDHDRAAKYVSASSLYKQAGNSICTCCLIAIFNALFLEDYSTSYAEKLVDYNS